MSSDNKVDKDGLTYFWNKATAYIQETIEYAQQLWVKIGNIQMGTTAATITGAIKELVDKIGNTAMGTTATTVTGAVKEHNDLIGDETMGTTATTLTGAIAEHETDITNLNSNKTTLKVVQTQLALPSGVNISGNSSASVLSGTNLRSLTHDALTPIPETGTIVAIVFLWANGGVWVPYDIYLESNTKANLVLRNMSTSNLTVNKIRLLVFLV